MCGSDEFRDHVASFDSLFECIAHLAAEYPEPRDLEAEPKVLFRGESSPYPSTVPVIERLLPEVAHELNELRIHVHDNLAGVFQQALQDPDKLRDRTVGYLQHYGFPTPLVDLTSNVLVAAYFASKAHEGLIGVFEVDKLHQNGTVWDLRQHEFARRARSQHAFALSDYGPSDLKTSDTRASLGITWLRIKNKTEEQRIMSEMTYIEDSHYDMVASLVTSSVFEVIRQREELSDPSARHLAEKLPPIPAMATVTEAEDGSVEHHLAPPAESGIIYVPTWRRARLHRIWSSAYPDKEDSLEQEMRPPT